MTDTTALALPDRHDASVALHDAAQALALDVFGDARATQIPCDDFTVLTPGEVLAVFEPRHTKLGAFGPEEIPTVEAIMHGGYDLYVVRSVTKGGTMNLDQIANPGSDTRYLADLAVLNIDPQRMRVSANRLVYRTGRTYDGIREALLASPLRTAFDAALAVYTAAIEAEQAAWKAEHDAILAAEAPFKRDAEVINMALNWRVASVPGYGTPRVEIALGGRGIPTRILRNAIIGEAANHLDPDNDTLVRRALAALDRYEAAKEGR